MRLTTPTYEMLSLDGPYLQYIFIQEQSLAQPMRNTQRHIEPTMLPHEVAAIIKDTLQNDPQIRNFSLLESVPALVGGQLGFRLEYTYTDNQGVDIKCIYYGTILTDTFLNIRYAAAQRHYFDKNLKDFEQLMTTLRISEP